jgi:hypothetical protein
VATTDSATPAGIVMIDLSAEVTTLKKRITAQKEGGAPRAPVPLSVSVPVSSDPSLRK